MKGPKVIQEGDIVTFDFDIFLLNGKSVLSSKIDGPFTINVGSPHLIPALNKSVIGMKKGDKKSQIYPASDCFGEIDSKKIREIKRDLTNSKLIPGQILMLENDNEAYRVVSVDNDKKIIIIDSNHILSGHCLKISIEITNIH